MMRAEKIASDDQRRRRTCCPGQTSPLPQLASLLRRLQRKAAEAPGLLDEVVKSLDEALISLDARADPASRRRCARPNSIRSELEQAEERLFALRAAARKYRGAGRRPARSCATRWSADLADLDAGEERLARAGEAGAGRARRL